MIWDGGARGYTIVFTYSKQGSLTDRYDVEWEGSGIYGLLAESTWGDGG